MDGSLEAFSVRYLRPKFRLADGNERAERLARCELYAKQVAAIGGILRDDRGGRRTNQARPVVVQAPGQFDSVRHAAEFLRRNGLTRSDVAAAASSIRKRMRLGQTCYGYQFRDARHAG